MAEAGLSQSDTDDLQRISYLNISDTHTDINVIPLFTLETMIYFLHPHQLGR